MKNLKNIVQIGAVILGFLFISFLAGVFWLLAIIYFGGMVIIGSFIGINWFVKNYKVTPKYQPELQ